MSYHSGLRYQRGRGLGALFGGLIRGFAPIARLGLQAGKSLLKSNVVQNIGRSLLDSGKQALTNVAADFLEGKDIKQTAQEELDEAKRKIASTLRGSGHRKKRKKSCQPKICNVKRKKGSYNLFNDD
jgi:exonuclease VII small subunit